MGHVYGKPDGTMLHFELGFPEARSSVPEMARYAYARSFEITKLEDKVYVSLLLDYKVSSNITQRARTFGWRPVAWRPGLPPAPIRAVTARAPGGPTRVGRPFTWLQTVMFDAEPSAEQVALVERISEHDPRRGLIQGQTSTGKWEVTVWRDHGWTRTEDRAFWEQMQAIGGRPVRTGDFRA